MRLYKLKIIVVFLLIVTVISVMYAAYSQPKLLEYSEKVETYFIKDGSDCVIKTVKRGETAFLKKGESCEISLSAEEILKKLDVIVRRIEITNGIVSYYGYTKKFNYSVNLYGEIINVHIAAGNGVVRLGTPIIYGSY